MGFHSGFKGLIPGNDLPEE